MTRSPRRRSTAAQADELTTAALANVGMFAAQPPPAPPSGAVVISLDADGVRRRIACSPRSALAYLRNPRYRAAVVSGAEHLAPAALAEALAAAGRDPHPIEPDEDLTA